MSNRQSRQPPYPSAPEIERRISLPRWRAVGMGLILLVPIMAVAGVFGDTAERTTLRGPNVSAAVEFPTRFRYEMLNYITVSLTNTAARPVDTINVSIDTAYLSRFSGVVFTPSAEQAYVVPVTEVAPGETRLVRIEIQGNQYGRHTGALHIESTSGDTLSVALHSIVFP